MTEDLIIIPHHTKELRQSGELGIDQKPYVCYLIKCIKTSATYIGITNDFHKRLRQHNGVIVGGAKRTRGKQWKAVLHVSGCMSKREVLMFEWAWQKRSDIGRKCAGMTSKLTRLCNLLCADRWTRAAPLAHLRPLTITIMDLDFAENIRAMPWPPARVSIHP